MSIPVDPADLQRTLDEHGDGYLLSTSAEGHIKAITVTVRVEDSVVVVPAPSRGTAANLADNPAATLLFPPVEPGGYTLLVDGTAEPSDEGFRFSPTSAVLHRPAAPGAQPASDASSCGHDCAPLPVD